MNENMGSIIMRLRKEREMTQEQLANALGITFQAVSKWENGVSSPDISTLPLLADLFGVSMDELFGRAPLVPFAVPERKEVCGDAPRSGEKLPWPDDNTFYAVLYHGHSLIGNLAGDPELEAAKKHFVFQYEGPIQNIRSDFSVEVNGDVYGSVEAGTSLKCDDIGGSVNAGSNVDCGDVDGNVRAGGSVRCGDVDGSVSAGGNVSSSDVGGNVSAGSSVKCGDVDGDVHAGTRVNCGSVSGGVYGGFHASGDVRDQNLDELERNLDEFDRELDEMIDRQLEDSIRLSMNMSDFGEELGQKLSAGVQRAVDFGNRFWKRNSRKQDEMEE